MLAITELRHRIRSILGLILGFLTICLAIAFSYLSKSFSGGMYVLVSVAMIILMLAGILALLVGLSDHYDAARMDVLLREARKKDDKSRADAA